MASGEETQNNRETGHETNKSSAGDHKSPDIPAEQPVVEPNTANAKKDHYFAQFSNWVSLLTLLFVAAYTVVTFVQWRGSHIFNKKQLRVINAQLSEMRGSSEQTNKIIASYESISKSAADLLVDTQRAWVSADMVPDGLSYDTNGVRISLKYVLKNTGHSPGQKVSMNVKVFPNLVFPRNEQEIVCTEEYGAPGSDVFPGDNILSGIVSYIDKDTFNEYGQHLKSSGSTIVILVPFVFTCLKYKIRGDKNYHITPRTFTLVMSHPKQGRGCCAILVDDGDIPAKDLQLLGFPIGDSAAN
jgi:hypothetical protein